MKRCQMFFATLCSLAVLFAVSANAAVPQTISYQGRLTDAAGDPVPDVPILVKFIIYDAAVAGAMLWNSGFQSITPTDGLFTYPLGSNVVLPDNLFTDTIRYLGITVDVDPELTPRERFRTVPYAYHALRTDTAKISATVFDGAITGPKLAAMSVTNTKLAFSSVGGDKIIDGSINASDLASNSVGLSEMQSNSVGSAEVIDNSLTAADLASGSVGTSEVIDNTLTSSDLAPNSVGNSEMIDNAIGSPEVIDNSLKAVDLAANSVGVSEIAANSVGNSEMLDNAIGSAEVINNSLTAADLAAGSVGASELATGSVVGGVGGDILDNTITTADILTSTINSSDIQNATILGADIANSTITGSHIVNGSITGTDIATGSIFSSDIANSTITGIDIVSGSIFDIDLGDEPGVAQNTDGSGSSTISSTAIASMMSRTLTAPTSGFILAIATCEASVVHSAGVTTSANFGVSEFATSRPSDQDKEIRIPNTASSGLYDHVVTVVKIFGVPSGPRTIHFVANKSSASPNWTLFDRTLSLVFFPTQYGTVTETPPSPPGSVNDDEQ